MRNIEEIKADAVIEWFKDPFDVNVFYSLLSSSLRDNIISGRDMDNLKEGDIDDKKIDEMIENFPVLYRIGSIMGALLKNKGTLVSKLMIITLPIPDEYKQLLFNKLTYFQIKVIHKAFVEKEKKGVFFNFLKKKEISMSMELRNIFKKEKIDFSSSDSEKVNHALMEILMSEIVQKDTYQYVKNEIINIMNDYTKKKKQIISN